MNGSSKTKSSSNRLQNRKYSDTQTDSSEVLSLEIITPLHDEMKSSLAPSMEGLSTSCRMLTPFEIEICDIPFIDE